MAQDNLIVFDALNRITDVYDRYFIQHTDYDANGNRTHVKTRTVDSSYLAETWNAFDNMNRETVVDGTRDANGNAVIGNANGKPVGQAVYYDNSDNRIFAMQYGTALSSGYNVGNGTRAWFQGAGYATETYGYDAAGRLTDVWRNGAEVSQRSYDAASRLVSSKLGAANGSNASLLSSLSAMKLNTDGKVYVFDAAGRAKQETDWAPDGSWKIDVNYTNDIAGTLQYYVVTQNASGSLVSTQYGYTYAYYDERKVKTITAYQTQGTTDFIPGTTTNSYDGNGYLVRVDSTTNGESSLLTNDIGGRALDRNNNTRSLIVNSQVLGSLDTSGGTSIDTFKASYASLEDMAMGSSSVGTYTVQSGDTLQSIARACWGDDDLWYLIADANGLTSVTAGQQLIIPARVGAVTDNYQNVKPYDPARIVGDTTPQLGRAIAASKPLWTSDTVSPDDQLMARFIAAGFGDPRTWSSAQQQAYGQAQQDFWAAVAEKARADGISAAMHSTSLMRTWPNFPDFQYDYGPPSLTVGNTSLFNNPSDEVVNAYVQKSYGNQTAAMEASINDQRAAQDAASTVGNALGGSTVDVQRVVNNYFATGDKNNLALGQYDISDLDVPIDVGDGALPRIPSVSLPQINISARGLPLAGASSELHSSDDLQGYNTYWGLPANSDGQIAGNIGGTTYYRTMAERVDSALARASQWVDEQAQNVADSGVQAVRDGNNFLAGYQAFMYTPTKALANVINGFINLPRLATSDEMVPNLAYAVTHPGQTADQIVKTLRSNSLQDNTALALSMLVPLTPKLAKNVGSFGRLGTYLDGTVEYNAGRGVTLTTSEGSFKVRSPIFVDSPTGQLNSGIPVSFRNPLAPGTIERSPEQIVLESFSKDAPYVIRYDPAVPGRPDPKYSVDSLSFENPRGYNSQNYPRDAGLFWKQWAEQNPDSLSTSNQYLIDNYDRMKVSPRIDQTWIDAFPEHGNYMGDVLIHHHVDFGQYTIPVPGRTHRGSGGPWHM